MNPVTWMSSPSPMESRPANAVPDLDAAASEFEAYLIGAMLRTGSKPLFGDNPLDGGSAGRMYREQFYDEVARLAAGGDGFGIARLFDGAGLRAGAQKEDDL